MREIRGWNIGQVVTMAEMTLDTANVLEEIGSNGKANLPCIYNGLSLQSQSGTGGSIVTFNPGVARCQDLPTSIYTYLPSNTYGNSYPCFIDISVLDSNEVITLSTGITSGYIVATFAISPNTPGAVDYVITGSLLQIATGSYNPAIHVRLCAFTYSVPNFTLDFTPGTSRDTDLTGIGGVQWDYQNSQLVINTPESQVGTNGVYFPNKITPSSFIAPTQQILVGSGTYTAPALRPLYIRVQLWAPGGGGQGSGINSAGGDGGDGGNTTFGTSLLIANGGKGGSTSSGGTASFTGATGIAFTGQSGSRGVRLENVAVTPIGATLPGGKGGLSFFSNGAGGDGGFISGITTGSSGDAGDGGGGGGSLDVIIVNPTSSYLFSIGAPGAAGTAGPGGFAGQVGNVGGIIVTEYYS